MTTKVPSHAVRVWVEGFALCIAFEDKSGTHVVMAPLNRHTSDGTNIGYEIFMNILREREKGGRGKIGTKFQPVQHDVEKAVRDFGKRRPSTKPRPGTPEQRAAAAEVVAKLIGKS